MEAPPPPPDLPEIRADRAQLELVLFNLALNARDAMPEGGGRIRLRAEATTAEGGSATPGLGLPGAGEGGGPQRYVRLVVEDDGQGMDEETRARATEPFFTTKDEGKGTGLGLSMAHGFALQSGGALQIESAPGRGTAVSLWLPAAEATPAAADGRPGAEQEDAAAALRADGLTVLLVDDEAGVRAMLAEALRDSGLTVIEAEDARVALARLDEPCNARPDALITDLAMPGPSGLALAAEARRRLPGLPVLVLTGDAGFDQPGIGGDDRTTRPPSPSELEAAAASGLVLLRKPVAAAELIRRIAQAVRGGGGGGGTATSAAGSSPPATDVAPVERAPQRVSRVSTATNSVGS